jgi:hypothetical protein
MVVDKIWMFAGALLSAMLVPWVVFWVIRVVAWGVPRHFRWIGDLDLRWLGDLERRRHTAYWISLAFAYSALGLGFLMTGARYVGSAFIAIGLMAVVKGLRGARPAVGAA